RFRSHRLEASTFPQGWKARRGRRACSGSPSSLPHWRRPLARDASRRQGRDRMDIPEPNTFRSGPDREGMFGKFGGRFVAETLMPLILDLERHWKLARNDEA